MSAMKARWSALTSATTAEAQMVPIAPVATATVAAIIGRTPSRIVVDVMTARATATQTAANRFARKAIDPIGSSSKSQAARMYVG
jgi:RNA polymerase-interacting CarD/CdnL/TRCF family regulator